MNLGSIKDKTGKTILKKKNVRKVFTAVSVACVAVIAVTGAIALTQNSEQSPVLEAPKNTSSQASNGNGVIVTKAPEVTVPPTSTPEGNGLEKDSPTSSGATVTTTMLMPVTGGSIIKGYASDTLVYSSTLDHWSTHTALDISAPEGTTVLSVLDGTVSTVVDDELMGLTVTVSHENGLESVYSALESVADGVEEGASLLKGQAIGALGNSASSESSDGAHLHFEVKKDGKSVNPQSYMNGSAK